MSRARLRRYYRHGLLPQLFVFEAVARLESVTRAADELHLAQPTVSLQLKRLSETLELRLFEQHGRRLYLTGAGETLSEICNELMDFLADAEARLAPLRVPERETLRLAAEPDACPLASRLLADFCAAHPGVQGSLHIAGRDELSARFGRFEDDIYLFEVRLDDTGGERRWSVTHAKAGPLVASAAQYFRSALAGE
jgi:DNA-binding transcriptional LysR family regulator